MTKISALVALTIGAAWIAVLPAAQAGDYPAGKPVLAVVPFAAGGPTDRVARDALYFMSKYLGTSIVVENLGGAGSTIGTQKVARAKNDGYTILIGSIGMAIAPAMYPTLSYDPLKDFDQIGEIADVPMVLVGSKTAPVNDLKALIPFIQAKQEKLSMVDAGLGSASQLCSTLFLNALHAKVTAVSYKGSAPAHNDLLGGHVDLMCDQTTSVAGHLQAGTLKAYAVMQSTRVNAFKDIPTATEQGLPGVEVKVWHGVYAPKGTPRPIVEALSAALQKTVGDPDFRAKMAEMGAEAVSVKRATPESLRAFQASEISRWTPIIRRSMDKGQ